MYLFIVIYIFSNKSAVAKHIWGRHQTWSDLFAAAKIIVIPQHVINYGASTIFGVFFFSEMVVCVWAPLQCPAGC